MTDSKKVEKVKSAKKVEAVIDIDMSKPITIRPLKGLDIEQWVWSAGLSKHEAHFALGFRNANHYSLMCKRGMLPVTLEVLIRLYYRFPDARGWGKFTTRDLYDRLYGKYEEAFEAGTKQRLHAQVDLGSRFCKLFGRSVARQYEWIRDAKPDDDGQQYAEIDAILAKLHEVNKHTDAALTFQEVALMVSKLRGVDIDAMHPIPTPDRPPLRKKVGRPFSVDKAAKKEAEAKKSISTKKPSKGRVL